jgi:hypothetical protein
MEDMQDMIRPAAKDSWPTIGRQENRYRLFDEQRLPD